MGQAIKLAPTVVVGGITWTLYSFNYQTADGNFSSWLYAISREHAVARLAELKDTAVLFDEVLGVTPDNGDDPASRLTALEAVCEGLTGDHIAGGWTAKGMRAHCKAVEAERDRLRVLLTERSESLRHIASLAEGQLELISSRAPGRFLDKAPMVKALSRYREIARTMTEIDDPRESN